MYLWQANGVVNGTITFIRSQGSKRTETWPFSHMMPLVPELLSCNITCISNGTIMFIGWRQLKQGVTWFFWSCDVVGISASIMTLMVLSLAPFCLLAWDNWNEAQHHFFDYLTPLVLASPHPDRFVNGTIAFLRPSWLKWSETWHFWSCDAICNVIGIMCHQWQHQWHCWFLWSRQSKWGATWLFGHVMPLVLVSASHYANSIINDAIAFLRSRWLKSGKTLLIWSFDTICTSITWFWWHYQWHHCIC